MQLLSDRIAVIPLADPDRIGSIWVPPRAKQRVDQGIIKYVGSGVEELELGMHVFFGGYVGSKVSIEGEVLIICREDDVLAIFDEDPVPMFTIPQIRNVLESSKSDTLMRSTGHEDVIALFEEIFTARIDGYFFAEGLNF